MPCSDHANALDKSCVNCFVADMLALDLSQALGPLGNKISGLQSRYSKLELTDEEEDYCRVIIASLNIELVAKKLHFGSDINPQAIQPAHRANYRARLKRMGTWVGFTEFEALAAMFHVRFFIAIPARGGGYRRYEVGTNQPGRIPNLALIWSGNHYTVGTLTAGNNGTYNVTNELQTNKYGDCGLESFLLLLYRSPQLVKPHFGNLGNDARYALAHFRLVAKRTMPNQVLRATDDDYQLAISHLRTALADAMTDIQVNEAIIAEGEELSSISSGPEEKAVEGLTWGEYLQDFQKRFTLKKALVSTGTSGGRDCVANISAAADWLAAVNGVEQETLTTWSDMRDRGLSTYDNHQPAFPLSSALMHTGVMVARVTDAKKKSLVFVCAASNYHESRVNNDIPWIYTGNIPGKPVNGKGDDMHTERFSLVQLFEWLARNKIQPVGTIEIVWFLEKIMCDACQTVLARFVSYWKSQGVQVNSETDANFGKNVKKANKLLS